MPRGEGGGKNHKISQVHWNKHKQEYDQKDTDVLHFTLWDGHNWNTVSELGHHIWTESNLHLENNENELDNILWRKNERIGLFGLDNGWLREVRRQYSEITKDSSKQRGVIVLLVHSGQVKNDRLQLAQGRRR